MREEVELLEYHADMAADEVDIGALGRDGLSVDGDVSSGRLFEPVDAAQERGLAGTGRSDDADDLARLDLEVDAVEDQVVAECLLELRDFDLGFRHQTCILFSMVRETSMSTLVMSRNTTATHV